MGRRQTSSKCQSLTAGYALLHPQREYVQIRGRAARDR
jgi:hypothetical protein